MKTYQVLTICFASLFVLLSKCANPITPTGGPRDTIPPSLVNSRPDYGQLNYEQNIIRLEFDEYVNADQLTNNLIITPNQDIKYTSLIKKNQLILKLNTPFTDSTTYTFNFFNGVTDITEKNPATNLILPFSTGDYIDSIQISGTTKDLWTQRIKPEVIVGLYPYTDTLNLLQTKPTYFIKSDDDGSFRLQNIKIAQYRLLAFEDKNSNLLLDPNDEPHAFIDSAFHLHQNIDSISLQTVLYNPYTPKIISARPLADFFQVRLDKSITTYTTAPIDTSYQLYSQLEEENTTIKYYNQPNYPDSLLITLGTSDSALNQTLDSLYIRFNESKRRKPQLAVSYPTRPVTTTTDTLRTTIKFDKPISDYDLSLFTAQADTILTLPVTPTGQWNHNYTQVSLNIPFSWSKYQDSIRQVLRTTITDTTVNIDQLTITQTSLNIPSASFTSVEDDTTTTIQIPFKYQTSKPTGILRYQVQVNHDQFFVHLIDKDYRTIQTLKNQRTGTFTELPAGTYSIRILIDTNRDGQWQNANLPMDQQHEPIYVYQEFTELRNNWDITIGPVQTPY